MAAVRYAINKNKYLLPPEVDHLNQILKAQYGTHLRDCLLIEIALKTGARAQEVLNLQVSDVNSYDQSIFIRGIKGSNDREIPIQLELFNHLNEYITPNQGARGKIFDIGYDRLLQIWHFYRPVLKTFHSLRHTFAIRLYQKTKDLRLVQVALGHRNITNTMIYADYIYSQEELKKFILD